MCRGPPSSYPHIILRPTEHSSVYWDNLAQAASSSTQVIPAIHRPAEVLSAQRPVSLQPHVQNVMHPGSGFRPPQQDTLSKRKCHFELQMLASCNMKEWRRISAMTAIESMNQAVVYGWRTESDPWYLSTYQNNLDGMVEETRMDDPCQHYALFGNYSLITVVQNVKELVAVLCGDCNDIKLVDLETEQVTSVFKSPVVDLINMCPGPDGGLFVALYPGNILQLNSSFSVTNTFELCSFFNEQLPDWWLHHFNYICHLPAHHNTLVVKKLSELRAVSLQDRCQVWSQECLGFMPKCLFFWPQQHILLVSEVFKPEVCVLNPSDSSTLQTIQIPDIVWIDAMCLCNNQIIMSQWAEKDRLCWLLSYYNLKRVA